jgi:hypothetical protein
MITALAALMFTAALLTGCSSTAGRQSKSLTIAETADGRGLELAVSEALARSLFEDVVGGEIACGADIDDDFAGLLRELEREGRSGRAAIRSDDGAVTARRSGSKLEMTVHDADGGGRLEVRMPWTVAECLLDGSATLRSADADSIRVRIVGGDGGSLTLAVK